MYVYSSLRSGFRQFSDSVKIPFCALDVNIDGMAFALLKINFWNEDGAMQEIMFKTRDPSESVTATDLRGLSKLKALGSGDNRAKAQALKTAAQQFEQLLNQYWMNAMRSSNDSLNPDSPLHSKYSSMFEDTQKFGYISCGQAVLKSFGR